jgi:hypothetical protein
LIFGSDNVCEILSIIVVNTTSNPLLFDATILREETSNITLGTDPFITLESSSTVIVDTPTGNLTEGQSVTISGATATGGILANQLNITALITILDENTFSYVAGGTATSSTTGGGSTVQLTYMTPINAYFADQVPIPGFGKMEIVNLCINNAGMSATPTILYMEAGDTLFANSDNIINTFDCLVCGRQFLELT